MMKKIFTLLLLIISATISSQTIENSSTETNTSLITLKEFVDRIKAQNTSIKNAENVNVMVNDLLIENLNEYRIDPKSVSRLEVLVLDPKAGRESTKPSIIITTKRVK